MNDTVVRKPLRSLPEIDAAYPEHAKLLGMFLQEEGAEKMIAYLQETFFRPASDAWEDLLQELSDRLGVDALDALEETLRPISDLIQLSRRWDHDPRKEIFSAFGIDWKTFWREKNDMVEQLQAAMQDDETATAQPISAVLEDSEKGAP